MKKIYNKIAFYKAKDNFFRFFVNIFMVTFSPKYRYRRKNHMYSPKILMAQQFDKIIKFCEYANISYKDLRLP